MKDFVDLVGASGVSYRFRRLAATEQPQRIAGNFAVLRRRGPNFSVLFVGVTNDLSQVRAECPPQHRSGGAHFYTRLNVSSAIRQAEHADLSARYGRQRPENGE